MYLNGEEVGVPEDLKPYDLIEIGQCKLLFVAFCGEKFQWGQDGAVERVVTDRHLSTPVNTG